MNEEQREWLKQYNSNIGAREFLRVVAVIAVWLLLGAALTLITGFKPLFTIFFLGMFVFAFIAPRWRLTYSLLRKILGNKNLPAEPFPHTVVAMLPSQARPWWSYIPSLWWLILDLILLILVIRYLSK